MRLSLLAALLSTVLMPAAANAQRHDRGDHDRGDRGARVERSARPAVARPAPRDAERAQPRVARPTGQRGTTAIRRVDPNRFRQDAQARATTPRQRPDRPTWQQRTDRGTPGQWNRGDRNERADRGDRAQQWNRGDRNDRAQQWRDRNERNSQWNRNDRNDRDRWDRDRNDRNDRDRWDRDRNDRGQRWDRNRADWNDHYRSDQRHDFDRRWRDNSRYNWRDYRTRNRSYYHLPRYYAPHGWNYGYRRFSVGFRLNSFLFGSNYWISDPYYYRLPPAYGTYRWVRYYDDALLVDLRTGVVVDVVYDIFW